MLRFLFMVVPTAALASAVVVAVSRNGQGATAVADGDLQRDLDLASSTTIELAPAGQALATVSSVEAPPAATPERTWRPKRSNSGPRAVRSRAARVRAAPEPEPAEGSEELETTETTALTDAAAEATAEASDAGGVALPRPTGIPVAFPAGGADGGYDPGAGTVIRGGGVDGDHCQIHNRRGGDRDRVYGPPIIFRQPRSNSRVSVLDRIGRQTRWPAAETRRVSVLERIRSTSDGIRTSDRGPRGTIGNPRRSRR